MSKLKTVLSQSWNVCYSSKISCNILQANRKEFSNRVFYILLPIPFHKLYKTQGWGQCPGVTRRTGQNQCALLLEKSVTSTLSIQELIEGRNWRNWVKWLLFRLGSFLLLQISGISLHVNCNFIAQDEEIKSNQLDYSFSKWLLPACNYHPKAHLT